MNSVSACHTQPGATQGHHLTTNELALVLSLRPQSIRKRYSQTGSYFRLRPMKLKNGRLLWPFDAVSQLTKEEAR